MANTLKLGAGKWATGTDTVLAFNDENNNFKPLPFDFSRASSATVVNQSGLIETVGSGTPRIDFKDDAKGALLLEPQRTNAIRYSSDFSQWSIRSNVTINSNVGLAPDGTLSADRIVFNGTTNARVEDTAQGIDAFSYTNDRPISVWLKSESGTTTVEFGSSSSYLLTVTVTEEWQRFTYISKQGFARIKSDNATSVLAWGYQFETNGDVSLSYATSYIPTSGSAVTRVGDVCNNGGNAQVINSTEGVLYLEGSALADDVLDKRIFLSDGTMNNYVAIGYSRFAGNIIAEMVTGGVLQTVDWGATGVNKTNNNKFALSWGSGTMKFYVNGNQTNTESVTSPTGLNVLEFNTAVDTLVMYSNTRDLRVYNTALTSAELQALTTI